jgi:hypothetical protein
LAKKPGSVRNQPVQAKQPVSYATGQKRFHEAVRTGLGSEPVGPASFTSSSSFLVTLAWTHFVAELYECFDTNTNHLGCLTKLKQSGTGKTL